MMKNQIKIVRKKFIASFSTIVRIMMSVFFLFPLAAFSACQIYSSDGNKVKPLADPLAELLLTNTNCPRDVFALRRELKAIGLRLQTTMVANRGFHNPSQGSFSLFEMVLGESSLTKEKWMPGDFFFGHFTTIDPHGYLIADQLPEKNALLIEAFAWDNQKHVYNFYELRGDGKQGQWFYRGDSADILMDNQYLHLQPDPTSPQFGNRLRCAACHGNGGPIMKELGVPYNDWWQTNRPLNLGRKPDATLENILQTLVSAEHLANGVLAGIKKLERSNDFYRIQLQHSLGELLRPLFCPVEMNLLSDDAANEKNQPSILIPIEFFIDTRLLSGTLEEPITIPRSVYENLLNQFGSHFPETLLKDGDHAWLAPVKALADKIAIASLIKHRVIDKKFVADVLSIDMFNPIFSQERCSLLRHLPPHLSPDWQEKFIKNLTQQSSENAHLLAKKLLDKAHDETMYRQKIQAFLSKCRAKFNEKNHVEKLYLLLLQRRNEIKQSEISANPKGQILEPGFRIIFPKTNKLPTKMLKFSADCEIIEA